ncbi:VanZ family protein [uncultured Subdoligranulum sp.]|uniref:VanZ family protein n=1 Tax=uncultured Subdoligranulum sp. TaxID=512298 RepID=UPI0026084015|nr:VanZ family protein [uncultured Subdoligranulum sp.]
MKAGLLLGYEVLASLLPLVAGLLLWGHRQKQCGRMTAASVWIRAGILAVYAVGMAHVTGAGTVYDLFLYGGVIRPEQINLLPFSRQVDLTAYLLNIVLFLPFGFLAPWFCSRMSGAGRVVAGGLSLSLLVELSQLLNNRSTDVDDLLLNTLGALAGWAVYRMVRRWLPQLRQVMPVGLLWASLLLPFAGRFLLFYEVGVAKFLYGF